MKNKGINTTKNFFRKQFLFSVNTTYKYKWDVYFLSSKKFVLSSGEETLRTLISL